MGKLSEYRVAWSAGAVVIVGCGLGLLVTGALFLAPLYLLAEQLGYSEQVAERWLAVSAIGWAPLMVSAVLRSLSKSNASHPAKRGVA